MSVTGKSPTVFGVEMEYSAMVSLPGNITHEMVDRCHSVDAKLGLFEDPKYSSSAQISFNRLAEALTTMDITISGQGMLSNGGKFYLDRSGPEYCTPEATTAEETAIRTFDGDKIVLGIYEYLRKKEVISGFQLNRRIVDHNRSSRGVHINTTTTLGLFPDEQTKDTLATLNAVKGAIFGSGGLLLDEHGNTAFHHSPRLSLTTHTAFNGHYQKRPLVRFPFKEDGKLSRIETITSDALNFAWPLKASMVMTNLVVNMIELGYVDKLPVLSDLILAAHDIGQNGSEAVVTVKRNGFTERVWPMQIIREIIETAFSLEKVVKFMDAETIQVLYEVLEVDNKMSKDLFSVANQVESVGRLALMNSKMEQYKVGLNSEKACLVDYAWDWIGGGYAERYRNNYQAGWQGFKKYSARSAAQRLVTPPEDTRAYLRGNLIKESHGENFSDWHKFVIDKGEYRYFHPLATFIIRTAS